MLVVVVVVMASNSVVALHLEAAPTTWARGGGGVEKGVEVQLHGTPKTLRII